MLIRLAIGWMGIDRGRTGWRGGIDMTLSIYSTLIKPSHFYSTTQHLWILKHTFFKCSPWGDHFCATENHACVHVLGWFESIGDLDLKIHIQHPSWSSRKLSEGWTAVCDIWLFSPFGFSKWFVFLMGIHRSKICRRIRMLFVSFNLLLSSRRDRFQPVFLLCTKRCHIHAQYGQQSEYVEFYFVSRVEGWSDNLIAIKNATCILIAFWFDFFRIGISEIDECFMTWATIRLSIFIG